LGLFRPAEEGFGANTLTPYVGDANVETPEFDAFLSDIEKAAPLV
jgi:formate dehydrogenase major subunit